MNRPNDRPENIPPPQPSDPNNKPSDPNTTPIKSGPNGGVEKIPEQPKI